MNAERMFAVVLLGIAFFIRILPVTWGQPDPSFARSFHEKGMIHDQTPLHPDEFLFASLPLRKVLEPQSNFIFYENPSFLINVVYVVMQFSGIAQELDPADRLVLNERTYAPFSVYVMTRALSALGSLLAVAAAYGIARRTAGAWAACLAGLLTTFSLPMVAHSHYGTTSSLATGFATAGLFFALMPLYTKQKRVQDALLMASGVAIGLATGNRYNVAVVSIVLLIVGLWILWERRSLRLSLGVLTAFALFPSTFLLTTPGALFDTKEFLENVRYIYSQYYTGTPSLNVHPLFGLMMMLGFTALYGIGPIGMFLLVGLWRLRKSDRQLQASVGLIALFVMLYALLVLRTVRPGGADHLTVPILPALAVLVGVAFTAVSFSWGALSRLCIVLAVLVFPIYLSIVHLRIITLPDNREVMQRWIYNHIPPGSRFLLIGSINVALDPMDYPSKHIFALPEQVDYAAYSETDFLLISEAYMETYRKMGYDPILSLPPGAEALAVIYRSPRLGNEHPVFTSDYFHSPTIRLFCLNADACSATMRRE